jgi:hypothetical protein
MPHDRAQWSDDDTRLLLTLCLQEKEKFNFNLWDLTTPVGTTFIPTSHGIIRSNATTNLVP